MDVQQKDTQEHYTLSKDTDARTGHKSADSKFFGYKTHLAMTQERINTAAVVTSGKKVMILNDQYCWK